MSSNHGLLNRDLIGGTLSIKGREVIDKNRNVDVKDIVAHNVRIKGDLCADGKIVSNCDNYFNLYLFGDSFSATGNNVFIYGRPALET